MGLRYFEPTQLFQVDANGVPKYPTVASKSFLTTDVDGNLGALTPGNNAYMVTDATGVPFRIVPGTRRILITDGSAELSALGPGSQTAIVRKSGDITVISFSDNTVFAKNGSNDINDVTMPDFRTMLEIKGIAKSADESITNDNTISDDSELTLAVAANKLYLVNFAIAVDSHVTPDFIFSWTVPASAEMMLSANWMLTGTSTEVNHVYTEADGVKLAAINNSATLHMLCGEGMIRTAGTAGFWTFRWAQNTSNANTTIVKKNSMIHIQEFD